MDGARIANARAAPLGLRRKVFRPWDRYRCLGFGGTKTIDDGECVDRGADIR